MGVIANGESAEDIIDHDETQPEPRRMIGPALRYDGRSTPMGFPWTRVTSVGQAAWSYSAEQQVEGIASSRQP